jgi:transposase
MPEVLENANENLTPRMRNLVAMLWSEWKDLELQIVEMNDESGTDRLERCSLLRLRQIPGIGPLVATAIVASIGNGAAFHKGREFATWMGLVPKQHSTGGKAKLYGISKRGQQLSAQDPDAWSSRGRVAIQARRIAMGPWMTSLESQGAAERVDRRGMPTSWHGSHGRCSRQARTIGQSQTQCPCKQA